MESMIIHQGHRLAMSLASRKFSPASALNEMWHGVHQLRFMKKLTDNLDGSELQKVSAKLARIGRTVFVSDNMKIALIGEKEAVSQSSRRLSESPILADLECPLSETRSFGAPQISSHSEAFREGWSTSSAVSFVASTFETVRMGHDDAPALAAVSKLLRSLYLHREIREKGGAYGGFAAYDPETGLFSFGSYRDPHIISTLNVYARAADFIKSGSYEPVDIKEAVLQICSEIDKPDPPGPAARRAFYRSILSLSDETRKRFKKELLSLTRDRVVAVAEKYFAPDRMEGVAVISGAPQLEAANEKMTENPLSLNVI
jgi:Zn-dependent M16 (insulinase) family peptidase